MKRRSLTVMGLIQDRETSWSKCSVEPSSCHCLPSGNPTNTIPLSFCLPPILPLHTTRAKHKRLPEVPEGISKNQRGQNRISLPGSFCLGAQSLILGWACRGATHTQVHRHTEISFSGLTLRMFASFQIGYRNRASSEKLISVAFAFDGRSGSGADETARCSKCSM
jgi:hypothetical protein